ncbi:MAG TPA: GNAT family N-acetyltransferase [Chloroflexia bacterium]|nr:GNAT family N-acetyltransferase [Chloroflexia bacterium]
MSRLDPLRERLLGRAAPSDESPIIEPLTHEALAGLRLSWLSRFNASTLAAHLEEHPGLSLWVPATGEYIVGERWRRRDDIGGIVEVTARRGRQALIEALTGLLHAAGSKLVVLGTDVWPDQTRMWLDLGFGAVERIVFFERDLPRRAGELEFPGVPDLGIERAGLDDIDALVSVDHASFPWLWWNNADEFDNYLVLPDVRAYMALDGGQPVGYASYTMYNGWAHLDRLAVVQAHQGRRFGAAQLVHALRLMVEEGARSVSLSTQENNVQSHRLYRGFAFKQSRDSMYIYGKELDAAAGDTDVP